MPDRMSAQPTGLCPHGNFTGSCLQCKADAERNKESEPKSHYSLEADQEFLGFKAVEVTKEDETKPWKPALEVKVTKADGSTVEGLDAAKPFFTFKNSESGKDLSVSAAAAGHIDDLHIKGKEAGSHFDYASLEDLFKDVQEKLPDSVATDPGVSAFDMEMGKNMGKEGISSMAELLADGHVSESDVTAITSLKEEVFALNKSGTPEQKKALIEKFAAEHPDAKIKLQLVRGAVLVPIADAPKRDTTKLFMVFGPDAKGGKTMYTASPGRNMPRHPDPGQHKSGEGVLDEQTFKESSEAWFNTIMLTGK